MTNILLSKPTTTGSIRETAFYQPMTIGQTPPLLLIGHSDALEQEKPYQVRSMKEVLNWLQADSASPLLRGLLEAYNMGCRDIWLYSAAPMSEYIDDISDRNTVKAEFGGLTFYELYHQRLTTAYEIIKDYDSFEFIVPLEISFVETNDIDFTTPLAQLCVDIFNNSSKVCLGIIGTRAAAYDQTLFDQTVADSVLSTIGEKGKNVIVVMGEGIIVHSQMSLTYSASLATSTAALLCTTPLTRSITGITFGNVASLKGFDLKDTQIEQLAQAKINPVVRTQRGKRGMTFQTMLVTDNTLALDGSDYWSINQMRTVAECANTIRAFGNAYIGTTAITNFKQVVRDYFVAMVNSDLIKDFSLDISLNSKIGKATVTAAITPNFGIRTIYFTIETGPGS